MPWLPGELWKYTLFEKLFYRFGRRAHALLICVFGLSDAGERLEELVASVEAGVETRDRVRVIIGCDVLSVNH